jgi:hypothetical protein
MAETATASKSQPAKSKAKRQTREQRGLPPLSANQRAMLGMTQNAEKACKIIRQSIDNGETPSKEILQACSVLSSALAAMIGA